jgi:hypothetical protein
MPGRARHEAAATAHDSLTNAEKPQHNSLDRLPTASADRLRREDTVRPPRSRTPDLAPDPNFPTAAAVSGIMLAGSEIATGQDLEVEKLELEVSGLRKDNGELLNWLTGVFGLLLGVVGTATSV